MHANKEKQKETGWNSEKWETEEDKRVIRDRRSLNARD